MTSIEELENDKVRLIQYRVEHVPMYNQWMKDPYLQEMTSSEPLTLEEEYDLQKDWEQDPLKWIFLIADRSDDNRVVGDVDLFLHAYLPKGEAELLVMIAEPTARRKGLACQAVALMMQFAIQEFQIHRFIVKILSKNVPSIKMFEKLGFKQYEYVEAFDEVCLEYFIQKK